MNGGLERIRWTWTTDTEGVAELWDIPIDGTLHRLVYEHDDAQTTGGTYNVYLYDAIDCDVLLDYGASLSFGAKGNDSIRRAMNAPATGYRTIPVMGLHRLYIDAGTDTYGVVELYFYPRIDFGAGVR